MLKKSFSWECTHHRSWISFCSKDKVCFPPLWWESLGWNCPLCPATLNTITQRDAGVENLKDIWRVENVQAKPIRNSQTWSGFPENHQITTTPPLFILSCPHCNEWKKAIYFTNARSPCSFPTCVFTVASQAFPCRLLQHKYSSAVTFYGLLPSRGYQGEERGSKLQDFALSSFHVSRLLLSTAAEHFPAEHEAMRLMSPICDSLSHPLPGGQCCLCLHGLKVLSRDDDVSVPVPSPFAQGL